MPLAKTLTVLMLVAATTCGTAVAQVDDFRTRQLMNDVAELQRLVRQQAQRIDQLERQIRQMSAAPGSRVPAAPAAEGPAVTNQTWLEPGTWERVRPGMSAQEVLTILGVPTSMRTDENTQVRTLFYTLPVGDSGFLSGTVELVNDRVRAINRPTLK